MGEDIGDLLFTDKPIVNEDDIEDFEEYEKYYNLVDYENEDGEPEELNFDS